MSHLLDNLTLQVPRQNEDVVGPGLVDRLHRQDRDMHSRRELAMLMGIAIDGEIEKVRSDPAIVKKRIALAWRTISADPFTLLLDTDEQRQEIPLGPSHPIGERSESC